ncbi:MAG: His-Xaa-Ser system radical SAM maturase HxsB [Candidatus Omnitrophica bacterium]|nr:His-Xaa-Ser system radical SAM maturase HxsB [Candidatus Omnitrophota bacterium]
MELSVKPNDVSDAKTAIIPYSRRRIGDKFLVANVLGKWDFLDEQELRVFSSFKCSKGSPLFKRLYERGLIADENNFESLLDNYRNLNNNLFQDTSLHIAVVTTRCNLSCKYCQTNKYPKQDMTPKVASRVLHYLFSVKNKAVTLEFQGGEPLLNWETTRFLVENARKFNTNGKNLNITLVSNLTLLDSDKRKFLDDHGVTVCASFDGPKKIHDKNRIYSDNKGTYDALIKNIKLYEQGSSKKINLMPTITRHSLAHGNEIVEEYLRLGKNYIALRPVNRLGNAGGCWKEIGYDAQEFIDFYKQTFDYILELNKKGIFMVERMASFILKKIIKGQDPGYVELMSPCGAGRGQIVYMPDGSCYPCDESRMIAEDIFKLGNFMETEYEDMMKQENLLHMLESSVVNIWEPDSVFSPWTGTCPVLNYSLQKNLVPKIHCLPMHKIYSFQFSYIFEKILESEENVKIFQEWVDKGGY